MAAHRPPKSVSQGSSPWGYAKQWCVHIMVIISDCLSEDGSSILPRIAKQLAAVTQWIRVLRYERRSREFESLRWRHL